MIFFKATQTNPTFLSYLKKKGKKERKLKKAGGDNENAL